MSAFQGRFGAQASEYHAFRPRWPAEVYRRILARVPGRRARAVDLGAGTGMVTRELAESFAEVLALEPDERMLAQLAPDARLRILQARAEDAHFEPASLDLVTAGNAFHWMEGERVCSLVHAWLRPGGVFAVFRYDPPHAAVGALEQLLRAEYTSVWHAHVHARLGDAPYSRRTLANSVFGSTLEAHWLANDLALTLPQLMGFLRSTSYAGGHARSLADPEDYWRGLEERMRTAAGPGPFTLDFRVELLLATRA